MRRMVIAPHADDETFGCGGLLAKHPDTTVVVVAEPDEERLSEFCCAMREFGGDDGMMTVMLGRQRGFIDGHLGDDPARLTSALDAVLAAYRPDEVYLPFPSMHQDHVAVYECGMRSARLSMNADHWFPGSVLIYDDPAYDLTLYPTDLRWNVFESLTEQQVAAKARAALCYESQVPDDLHPARTIVEHARAMGAPRRLAYAEQYARIREVRA